MSKIRYTKDNELPESDGEPLYEVLCTDPNKKDPLNAKKISLNPDYYTLTWVCLQNDIFKKKKIRGVQMSLLPVDYFTLYLEFLFFSLTMVITLLLVIREAVLYDVYKEGSIDIVIERGILMVYALILMGPEFEDGYAKYLFTLKNPDQFTYPGFAKFVALDQLINAAVTLTTVAFFVCTADTAGDLLTNFSGLCVLSELDDWIGQAILYDQVVRKKYYMEDDMKEEEKIERREQNRLVNLKYDTQNLNERLNVNEKMSLIEEEDCLINFNEKVTQTAHWTVRYFDSINQVIPWHALIGLFTIPLSYGMPVITNHMRQFYGIIIEEDE